jgi:hypothetical protein
MWVDFLLKYNPFYSDQKPNEPSRAYTRDGCGQKIVAAVNAGNQALSRINTFALLGPWAPITNDCSISAVREGPAINTP